VTAQRLGIQRRCGAGRGSACCAGLGAGCARSSDRCRCRGRQAHTGGCSDGTPFNTRLPALTHQHIVVLQATWLGVIENWLVLPDAACCARVVHRGGSDGRKVRAGRACGPLGEAAVVAVVARFEATGRARRARVICCKTVDRREVAARWTRVQLTHAAVLPMLAFSHVRVACARDTRPSAGGGRTGKVGSCGADWLLLAARCILRGRVLERSAVCTLPTSCCCGLRADEPPGSADDV
jgi:hypothetical protein